MTDAIVARPTVFDIEGTTELPNHPSLKGCRCKCGYVYFPRQHYGCEACGRTGNDIEEIKLSGKGKLLSFATVHRSTLDKYKAPYIVASILLDDDCVTRALLNVTDDSQLKVGQIVYSTLTIVGHDEQGKKIVDLQFTPKF